MAGLIGKLESKNADLDHVTEMAVRRPEGVAELLGGLSEPSARIKYGCEKVLRKIGESEPQLLYPHFHTFASLLESENSFLKWGAIQTIANLVSVDRDWRFDRLFERYFAPIRGPGMITAANVVRSAGRITRARPDLADRIAREILKVEEARYENRGGLSPECNRVVCGHAVDAFEAIFGLIKTRELRKAVTGFVRRQLHSPRPQVRKKAERFLQRCGLDGLQPQ